MSQGSRCAAERRSKSPSAQTTVIDMFLTGRWRLVVVYFYSAKTCRAAQSAALVRWRNGQMAVNLYYMGYKLNPQVKRGIPALQHLLHIPPIVSTQTTANHSCPREDELAQAELPPVNMLWPSRPILP